MPRMRAEKDQQGGCSALWVGCRGGGAEFCFSAGEVGRLMSSPNRPAFRLAIDKDDPKEAHSPPSTHLKPKAYFEESDIHEEIELTLALSDERTIKLKLKIGDTVQNIKKRLEDTHGIPFVRQLFLLDGQPMLDPLSLNDFPAIGKYKRRLIEVKLLEV